MSLRQIRVCIDISSANPQNCGFTKRCRFLPSMLDMKYNPKCKLFNQPLVEGDGGVKRCSNCFDNSHCIKKH